MTNEVTSNAKAWREEVHQLFGLGWDRFVEWSLVAWLSAWIWTAWAVSNAIVFPTSGPISWIAEVVTALGAEPADWLVGIPAWLTDPRRSVLLPIAVVGAAVCATLSVRGYSLTGLRVLALAFAVVAVEIDGTVAPLLWIVLVAAIPFAVAFGLGFRPQDHGYDDREWSFFYPLGAIRNYLVRVLGLFAMPIAAPGLLAFALVTSYRIDREYRPAESLAAVVARELDMASEKEKTLTGGDPLLVASALVAAITSTSASAGSQRVAATFDERIRAPHGARATVASPRATFPKAHEVVR